MRIRALLLLMTAATLASAQTFVVSDGGVVNAASFAKQPVTGGSLVSIFGSNLAATLTLADSIPLSTKLGGVSVQFVNGTTTMSAPMLHVLPPNQLNVQVPWNLVPPGATQTVNVVVSFNGTSSVPAPVTVGPASPGIFTAGPPNFYAIAQNASDGTLSQPVGSIPGLITHPAKAGVDAVVIYATGLGAVDSAIADGANSLDKLRNTLVKPIVLLGGVAIDPANVLFSGLTPQFVGVNQVNILIPANAPTGDQVTLQFQMNGITTPVNVTMAISK